MSEINPEDHIAWVLKVASKFSHMTQEPVRDSEFYADAWVGLLKAKETFNPEFGYTFLTYAAATIRGEILDGIRRRRGAGRRGKDRCKIAQPAVGCLNEIEQHRETTIEQIVEHDDTRHELGKLKEAVELLPGHFRTVIECRMQGMKLQEIANAMGISKSRAEKIEKRSHRMLKTILVGDDSKRTDKDLRRLNLGVEAGCRRKMIE